MAALISQGMVQEMAVFHRYLLGLIVLSGLLVSTAAQDFNATATQQIIEATQSVTAQQLITLEVNEFDPFPLTATQLVRSVTQTAEAFTGNTAAPLINTPTPDVALSATALIANATATAQPGASQTNPSTDPENEEALSLTAIIFGGLVAVLTAIAGAFGLTRRGSSDV